MTDNVVVIKNFDNSTRSSIDPRPESASLRRPTTAVRKRPSSGLGGKAETKPVEPIKKPQPLSTDNKAPIVKKVTSSFLVIHPIINELNFLRKPKSLLDPAGDRFEFALKNDLKRGNQPYYQPIGWIRYGLNIKLLYPNIAEWLSKDGNAKEWAVGYHGFIVNPLKAGLFNKLFDRNKKFKPTLAPSRSLKFANDKDTNKASLGFDKTCDMGILLSPKAELAEAKTVTFSLNNIKYKMLLQCRIDPAYLRIPANNTNLYIVNTTEHIRPYGLLVKEVD